MSIKLSEFSSYREVESQFSINFIKTAKAVKYSQDEGHVKVIVSASTTEQAKNNIKQSLLPLTVEFIETTDSDFTEFIGGVLENTTLIQNAHEESSRFSLDDISLSSPAVNILNAICATAVRLKASDIHIEPYENTMRIRYRINGILETVKVLEKDFLSFLSSRIKVMANLNIMETRLPQDGSIQVALDNTNYYFRVSIIPLSNGESIVLRFFNMKNEKTQLEELGFSKKHQEILLKAINRTSGLIIVTGPTGSGKSTTIHSLLSTLDTEQLKIITIEDPVERVLKGVDQIQINEDIGLTFDSILRRILRQDPDVIMVGEIRDATTASLAIRASLTGHLVISTMHTNNSTECFSRLRDLGIENSMIAGTLYCCVAQRLARTQEGRTCIAEMFTVTDEIREFIEQNKTGVFLRNHLIKNGFITIQDDAKSKIRKGIVTKEEIKRIGLSE